MIPKSSTRGILFISLIASFCLGVLVVVFGSVAGALDRDEAATAMGAVGVIAPMAGFIVKSLLEDEPDKPKTITAPRDADVEVTVKSRKSIGARSNPRQDKGHSDSVFLMISHMFMDTVPKFPQRIDERAQILSSGVTSKKRWISFHCIQPPALAGYRL